MAVHPVIKIDTPHDSGIQLYKWSGIAGGDTGAPVFAPGHNDKTVRLSAVDGAGTVTIEGDLAFDTPVFAGLSNSAGDAIAFTAVATGISEVLENVTVIRPNVTGFTTVDVWLLVTC